MALAPTQFALERNERELWAGAPKKVAAELPAAAAEIVPERAPAVVRVEAPDPVLGG